MFEGSEGVTVEQLEALTAGGWEDWAEHVSPGWKRASNWKRGGKGRRGDYRQFIFLADSGRWELTHLDLGTGVRMWKEAENLGRVMEEAERERSRRDPVPSGPFPTCTAQSGKYWPLLPGNP